MNLLIKKYSNEIILISICLLSVFQIKSKYGSISFTIIIILIYLFLNIQSLFINKIYLIISSILVLYNFIIIDVIGDIIFEIEIRSWLSIFLVFIIGFYLFSRKNFKFNPFVVSRIILVFICLSILFQFATTANSSNRYFSIFFAEPSHLAIAIVPFIVFSLFPDKKIDWISILASLIISYFSFSSTLVFLLVSVIIFALIAKFRFFNRRNLSILFVSSMLITFFSILSYEHMYARIEGLLNVDHHAYLMDQQMETMALSAVVYANGWSLLHNYLDFSNGFGVGFNLMGLVGDVKGVYSDIMFNTTKMWLNFNDGSFLISKLGSEFGYFGILVISIIGIVALIKGFLALKILNYNLNEKPMLFLSYIIVANCFVSFFIRSTGYFDPGFLLFLFGISVIYNYKRDFS